MCYRTESIHELPIAVVGGQRSIELCVANQSTESHVKMGTLDIASSPCPIS